MTPHQLQQLDILKEVRHGLFACHCTPAVIATLESLCALGKVARQTSHPMGLRYALPEASTAAQPATAPQAAAPAPTPADDLLSGFGW